VQRILLAVADHPQAGQSGIDVEAGDAHRVIVVPEQTCPLIVGISGGHRLSAQEAVFGPAVVLGRVAATVHVYNGPGLQRFCGRVDPGFPTARRILRDEVR